MLVDFSSWLRPRITSSTSLPRASLSVISATDPAQKTLRKAVNNNTENGIRLILKKNIGAASGRGQFESAGLYCPSNKKKK
jgi:hypothetical protein